MPINTGDGPVSCARTLQQPDLRGDATK